MNAELVVRLQSQAELLNARVLDEMYRNPFWLARFGERGRQFARQDGQFHLSYLIQALVAGDPQVLAGYARWLQSVLTTRGMCTRHIDENFARLSRVIGDQIEWAAPAREYLEWARRSLQYEAGPGREVQDATPALVEAVRDVSPNVRHDDLLDAVSYLADAVALDRDAILVDHIAWVATGALSQGSASDSEGVDDVRRAWSGVVDRLSRRVESYSELSVDARERSSRMLQGAAVRLSTTEPTRVSS